MDLFVLDDELVPIIDFDVEKLTLRTFMPVREIKIPTYMGILNIAAFMLHVHNE
jgi:hypothetical protein